MVEKGLLVGTTVALVLGASRDWRTRRIPLPIGLGILAIGVGSLVLTGRLLLAAFCLSAVWGSRGGMWRLPIVLLAALAIGEDGDGSLALVMGVMYTLVIFWLGWFGGGDAQIAIGLIALAGDWWILAYLFGGMIMLAAFLLLIRYGVLGAGERVLQVVRHLSEPDEQAIRVPWALIAAAGGFFHIWIWPGGMWH